MVVGSKFVWLERLIKVIIIKENPSEWWRLFPSRVNLSK